MTVHDRSGERAAQTRALRTRPTRLDPRLTAPRAAHTLHFIWHSQCILLTPDQQLLNEQTSQVILPAHDGLMGILTDRAPIIVKLGIGPMRVDLAGGKKQFFFVDGGLAQMKESTLTVLTSKAIPSSEIDHQAAVAEYNEALARKPKQETELDDREKALQRARVKQALSNPAQER